MLIPKATIAGALRACLRTTSTAEDRPHLRGVLLRGDGDHLSLLSTDGHRSTHVRVYLACDWAPILLDTTNATQLHKTLRPRKKSEWMELVRLVRTSRGLVCGDLDLRESPETEGFPNLGRVTPDARERGAQALGSTLFGVNPSYLADAMQGLLDTFRGDNTPQAHISTPESEFCVIRVDFDSTSPRFTQNRATDLVEGPRVHLTALVMPCRI